MFLNKNNINLIDIIDNHLISKNTARDLTSHHPSSITSCPRQIWYKWKKYAITNPVDGADLFKMSIGNLIHDLLHEVLEAAKIDIINEVDFRVTLDRCMFPLSGRIDNLMIDPATKEIAGIEVKSSFGDGIKALRAEGKPKDECIWQVICYLIYAKIKKFYILYIARDKSYKTQFVMEIKDGDIYLEDRFIITVDGADLMIRHRLNTVEESLLEDTPPDRPYQIYIATTKRKDGTAEHGIKEKFTRDGVVYKCSWQCRYCGFTDECWKDDLTKYPQGTSNEDDVISYYNKTQRVNDPFIIK